MVAIRIIEFEHNVNYLTELLALEIFRMTLFHVILEFCTPTLFALDLYIEHMINEYEHKYGVELSKMHCIFDVEIRLHEHHCGLRSRRSGVQIPAARHINAICN